MGYVEDVLEQVKLRNGGEQEFLQTVEEVLHSLRPVLERRDDYRRARILERLEHVPQVVDEAPILEQLVEGEHPLGTSPESDCRRVPLGPVIPDGEARQRQCMLPGYFRCQIEEVDAP